jgi:hypothetical protein
MYLGRAIMIRRPDSILSAFNQFGCKHLGEQVR